MWCLGHIGHVTYSFINMLFISTGIFDKFRPQIVSVGTTANSTLIIKEYPEEILLKLAIVLKISKSI